MINKIKQKMQYFDWYLFIPFLVLSIIGIVMVYSASSIDLSQNHLSSATYLIKQFIYLLMGVGLVVLFSQINLTVYIKKSFLGVFYGVTAAMLLVAIMLSKAINGAKGWISIGGFFSIQPAEVCKLLIVLIMARALSYQDKWADIGKTYSLRNTLLTVGFLLLLIIGEPDIGGFSINATILLVMMLGNDSGPKKAARTLLIGFFSLEGLLLLTKYFDPFENPTIASLPVIGKFGYTYKRFVSYHNPFEHAKGAGAQLINSYYAISNGGLFGRGIGQSIQKRGYLPEAYTDFILSVIAEELGFIGVVIVLGLLTFLICRIFVIGIRSKYTYERLICYGIGTFMLVESVFNIAGVNGLLPITGVTLPFISYGGSSMVVLAICLGIVMKISSLEMRHAERDIIQLKHF